MNTIELDWSKSRTEPINLEIIEKFNKVDEYLSLSPQRRVYRNEHETLKDTAPVLKFTLQKEVPKLEEEVLDRILFSAFISNINDVIVSSRMITYIPRIANQRLEGDQEAFCVFLKKFIPSLTDTWQGTSLKISFNNRVSSRSYPYVSLYNDLLSSSSELKGIYSFSTVNSDKITFNSYTKRKDIYNTIFERGLAAVPGTPPSPVNINLAKEIYDAEKAVEAAKNMSKNSPYRAKLVSLLEAFCRRYRWKNDETLRKEVKSLKS